MALASVVNGRPIEPKVREMMTVFGNIRRGDTITHAQLLSATGERATTSRYRTLVSHWLATMAEERGIEFRTLKGVGYQAYETADEQLKHKTQTHYRRAGRAILRAAFSAESARPEELTPPAAKQRDYLIQRTAVLRASVQAERKLLEVSMPAANPIYRPK